MTIPYEKFEKIDQRLGECGSAHDPVALQEEDCQEWKNQVDACDLHYQPEYKSTRQKIWYYDGGEMVCGTVYDMLRNREDE